MFYEFAVDPQLVSLWCDREGYEGFLRLFGMDERRIPSRFPKKWETEVEKSFHVAYPTPTIKQGLRKTEIITLLNKRMVKRGSKNYEAEESWLENAEREHSSRPFKGIIATANPRNIQSVTVLSSAEDVCKGLPKLPSSCIVARTPVELAKPVASLLRCCQCAVFIDPYFNVSPRFLEPFEICLKTLVDERYGSASPKVELHTSIEQCFVAKDYRDNAIEAKKASIIMKQLQDKLREVIPKGLSVRVVIWKEKPRGQKLHNRYLLTDIGSVFYGTGLDCNKGLNQGQTDDIACLSEDAHRTRWDEFVEGHAFQKVDSAVIVGIA